MPSTTDVLVYQIASNAVFLLLIGLFRGNLCNTYWKWIYAWGLGPLSWAIAQIYAMRLGYEDSWNFQGISPVSFICGLVFNLFLVTWIVVWIEEGIQQRIKDEVRKAEGALRTSYDEEILRKEERHARQLTTARIQTRESVHEEIEQLLPGHPYDNHTYCLGIVCLSSLLTWLSCQLFNWISGRLLWWEHRLPATSMAAAVLTCGMGIIETRFTQDKKLSDALLKIMRENEEAKLRLNSDKTTIY